MNAMDYEAMRLDMEYRLVEHKLLEWFKRNPEAEHYKDQLYAVIEAALPFGVAEMDLPLAWAIVRALFPAPTPHQKG